MKFTNIIGIDIGKETLEFVLLQNGEKQLQTQVENDFKKIKNFFKSLKLDLSISLICMEHTGIYNHHLLEALHQLEAKVWLENAMQIKKSIGLTRGKNDKIDAFRIAQYALTHQEKAKMWVPDREAIINLKLLMAERSRLIKAKKMIEVPVKESKSFIAKAQIQMMKKLSRNTLDGIKKDLNTIEAKIKETINSDQRLQELFNIVTSVPNIGTVIGTAVIVSTNEFQKINNAKSYACHCGIAPFEYTSGKTIRGKTRVSHLANKEMKTLLHLAALGATSRPGEFKDYFNRKVEQGKNKMLVLNAIRNKLIQRIFACVNDNRKYIKNDLTFA